MSKSSIPLGMSAVAVVFVSAWANPPAILDAPVTEYHVIQRGEHHRVWERASIVTLPDGRTAPRKHTYTELADHLCYWDDETGQWSDTQEVIEIINEHGIARHGAHKVIFAPNLHSYGAIEVFTPDQQRLRLHPLGLAYTDRVSGDSVLIAEVRDSIGEVSRNEVLYPDCLTDGLTGSIQYVYTRSGIEQNVILRCIPPDPLSAYGLDPETTVLEVITEVVEAPQPVKTFHVLNQETDPDLRELMAEPDLVDEVLQFGAMLMPTGSAFPLNHPPDQQAVPTAKSWEVREGRQLLIEKIEYRAIRRHLEGLPQAGVGTKTHHELQAQVVHPKGKKATARFLPPALVWQARSQEKIKPIQTASRKAPEKGYVLDYTLLNASSLTNYTFHGDTTYFVNGGVSLPGLTVIEGGTVIKYTNYANGVIPRLDILGGLDCHTSSYRPAVFTAQDDDIIGEVISGSTGSPPPTNYYAYTALDLYVPATNFFLHDLSIHYTYYSVASQYGTTAYEIRDSQIGPGYTGPYFLTNCTMANVLLYDLRRALCPAGAGRQMGINLTIHRSAQLLALTTYSTNLHLTNCLLISVTNNLTFGNACNVVTNRDDSGIFQTVLGGRHYLADNSPYRDCGTTNLNSDLLKGLSARTTYPPLFLTNSITVDTVLAPQAQRDTDTPDLGYHYTPIDYLVFCSVSNATLLITNGTSLAAFKENSCAFLLNDNAKLISEGTPLDLNRFDFYSFSQEQLTNGRGNAPFILPWTQGNAHPEMRARFTHFTAPDRSTWQIYNGGGDYDGFTNLVLRDCQFHGGYLCLWETTLGAYSFTNNLFEQLELKVTDAVKADWFNNLFRNVDGYFWCPNGVVV